MAYCAIILASFGGVAQIGIVHVSQPVRPNETAIVQGFGLSNVTHLEIAVAGSSRRQPATVVAVTNAHFDSLHFIVPATFPWPAAYEIVIATAHYRMNIPRVQWLQGDQGLKSSASGWIRLFGNSIGLLSVDVVAPRPSAQVVAEQAMLDAVDARDNKAMIAAALSLRETAEAVSAARQAAAADLSLHLTSSDGREHVVLNATNATAYDAFFAIPRTIRAASYSVALASVSRTNAVPLNISWFESKVNMFYSFQYSNDFTLRFY